MGARQTNNLNAISRAVLAACFTLSLLWGVEATGEPKVGSSTGKSSKGGSKDAVDGSAKHKGPISEEAKRQYSSDLGDIKSKEEAATKTISNPSKGGGGSKEPTSDYSGAGGTASTAERSAQDIVQTAQEREQAAQQQRQDILQAIQQGQRNGEYSPQHVNEMRNVFSSSSRPKDSQLEALHPKLQDPAFALRTNQDHINELREKQQQYTRVAETAQAMSKKLNTNEKNIDSLGSGIANRPALGARNATYPTAAYPSSGRREFSTPDRKFGKFNGSSVGSASGGDDSSAGFDNQTGARYERSSDGTLARNGGGLPGAPGGKGNAAGTARAAEKTAAAETQKTDGEKILNSEGKALLAGMLKELQADLKGSRGSGEQAPAPVGIDGKLGNPIVERGLASVKDNTLLGGAILSITNEVSDKLRFGSAETFANNSTLNDLDVLGIDKSLFQRVNDAIRKKASAQGGLQ